MKMEGVTVETLCEYCEEQIALGNGQKIVLISSDDEGNGFHTLLYGFTDDVESIKGLADHGMFHDNNDPNEVVILE